MIDICDLPFPIVVTEVRALDDFRLRVRLQDGKQGIFDMKPYLGQGVMLQPAGRPATPSSPAPP